MPTKLRASCDACHSAKTKCIRSDQGCQRCASLGEQCFSSPTVPRTHYKRRSREPTSNSSPSTALSAGGPSILVGTASSTDRSTRPSLPRPASNAGTRWVAPEALTSASSTNINIGAANGPNDFYWPFVPEQSALGDYACEPATLAPDHWRFSGTSSSLTGAITTPNSLTTIVSPTPSLHSPPLSTTRQTKTSNEHEILDPHSSASWSLQTPSTLEACNCFPGLLTATQRVSGHASLSNAALDSVLSANRGTTKLCITSLNCAYSIDSMDDISCTAVACGLLDRVLASYHAALNSFCASLEREELDFQDQNENDSEDRAAMAGGIRVRLGAFAVENSGQVLYAREIVVREIEKLRAAVKGCPNTGGSIRSVLLEHLIKRCTSVINTIAS